VLAIGFTWAFDQLERFYIKNERSVSGANPLDLSPDAHQGPLIVGVLLISTAVFSRNQGLPKKSPGGPGRITHLRRNNPIVTGQVWGVCAPHHLKEVRIKNYAVE